MTVLGYIWDGVSVDFGSHRLDGDSVDFGRHRLDGESHPGRYSRDAPKNGIVRMLRVRGCTEEWGSADAETSSPALHTGGTAHWRSARER
jgi:hypothetical protein